MLLKIKHQQKEQSAVQAFQGPESVAKTIENKSFDQSFINKRVSAISANREEQSRSTKTKSMSQMNTSFLINADSKSKPQ